MALWLHLSYHVFLNVGRYALEFSKECGRQYLNPEDTLKDGIIRKYHFNSRKEHHFDLVFLKEGMCPDILLSQTPAEIKEEIDQIIES